MPWMSWVLAGLVLAPLPAAGVASGETAASAVRSAASRSSRLQGAVFSGRREGVVGATVLVRPEGDPSRLFLTSTDARGGFRVEELPDGRYRVGLEREGFVPVDKRDVELRFPFRAVVEVMMQPVVQALDRADPAPADGIASTGAPPSVTGRVLERDGSPLRDVTLRLVDAAGRADPVVVRTDPQGAFGVPDLAAGRWRVDLQGVGFLPIHADLVLDGPTRMEFSLVAQPPDYRPAPLELMPPEEPIPPAGFGPV